MNGINSWIPSLPYIPSGHTPERGLYTGTLAVGAIGSGKTRGLILPAMHQLFGYKANDPAKKLSGIVLEVKATSAGTCRAS